jgi:hypothetical protein
LGLDKFTGNKFTGNGMEIRIRSSEVECRDTGAYFGDHMYSWGHIAAGEWQLHMSLGLLDIEQISLRCTASEDKRCAVHRPERRVGDGVV